MRTDPINPVNVLTWAHLDNALPVDWRTGGLLFAAGLVGALLTLYLTSPDRLPALGGGGDLAELSVEVRRRRRLQGENLDRRLAMVDVVAATDVDHQRQNLKSLFEDQREHLRDMVGMERSARRSLLTRGVPIFLLLGPVAAAAFSNTVWQALLVGSVGPALIATLSARRDDSSTRTQAADELSALSESVLTENQEKSRQISELQQRLDAAVSSLELVQQMTTNRGEGGATGAHPG